MRAGSNSAVLAIVWRRAAEILLLGAITSGPAAAQPFDRDPHTEALRLSSREVPAPSRGWPIPTNLMVPEVLRPLVTSMYRQSPTFRRQCARLAEHQEVTVRIELEIGVRYRRARSRVERGDTGINAAVQIELREPALYVELIAHELEHVLEQVDGTDLARLARYGLGGVADGEWGYETARAQSVGRLVAREAKRP